MNLNDSQKRLLETVKAAYEQVDPAVEKIQATAEQEKWKAKRPLIEALAAADAAGVPRRQVVDALGFGYPVKLAKYLTEPETAQAEEPTPEQAVTEAREATPLVFRDSTTGYIKATVDGEQYSIKALGSDAEMWSLADPSVPQKVYDTILESFPNWVVVEP